MHRRVGTRLLSSLPLLLSSALGGCYAHHTADEELLELEFPDETYPDAGAPVPDAGPTNRCTQTDPIQLLICQFTQGGGGGLPQIPGFPGIGGGTADAGAQAPNLGGLQDLIDQLLGGGGGGNTGGLGGIQDIIDLLGGLQGGGAQQPPSFEDILAGLGIPRRDGGTQQPTTTGVTEAQCATATSIQLRIQCALNGFQTPAQGRRDGGTGFQWPFPTPGQGNNNTSGDAGVPDQTLL